MDRLNRKVIEANENYNRLIVVTWFDPYDGSDEVTVGNIKVTKAVYRTPGYLVGIDNDQLVLGNNQEYLDEKPTGTYKGHGVIPLSLITNVEIMDRNC